MLEEKLLYLQQSVRVARYSILHTSFDIDMKAASLLVPAVDEAFDTVMDLLGREDIGTIQDGLNNLVLLLTKIESAMRSVRLPYADAVHIHRSLELANSEAFDFLRFIQETPAQESPDHSQASDTDQSSDNLP